MKRDQVLSAAEDDPPPPLMTIAEAAAELRIGRTVAYQLAQAGELPGAFKVGSQWRIRRRDFLAAYGLD